MDFAESPKRLAVRDAVAAITDEYGANYFDRARTKCHCS